MTCNHTIDDRENAVLADGFCPPCMAAEIERLRTALTGVERELVNLQPHIPQDCIQGHEGFIDDHIDAAIKLARKALYQQRMDTK